MCKTPELHNVEVIRILYHDDIYVERKLERET